LVSIPYVDAVCIIRGEDSSFYVKAAIVAMARHGIDVLNQATGFLNPACYDI